jgi:hypothetical protein
MKRRHIVTPQPLHSADAFEDWSLDRRCGISDMNSFFSDQKYLFLRNIYSGDDIARESLTSFAVKRDMFINFFPFFDQQECMTGTFATKVHDSSGQATSISSKDSFPASITTEISLDITMMDNSSDALTAQPSSHGLSLQREGLGFPGQSATLPQPNLERFSPISARPLLIEPVHQAMQIDLPANISNIGPIKWQTSSACACAVNITPDEFFTAYRLQNYTGPAYVLFFQVSK